MLVLKEIVWVGDSRESLQELPDEIRDSVGYTLYQIQEGRVPRCVKPLRGIKPVVMEIVSNYDTNAYRTFYTVKIDEVIYVLHCFQKKSKFGIKTPKQEIQLIKQRLREAEFISKTRGQS